MQEMSAELVRKVKAIAHGSRVPAPPRAEWLARCRRAWEAVRRALDVWSLFEQWQASCYQGAGGWAVSKS